MWTSKTKISVVSHQWKVALDANDPYGSGLRLVTFASSTPTYRGFPSDLEVGSLVQYPASSGKDDYFNFPNSFPESEEGHGKDDRVSCGCKAEDVCVYGRGVGDDGCKGEAPAQRG